MKSGHIDFLPSGPTWPWLLCCNDDNGSALVLTCSISVQTQLFSLQRALPTSVLCCWDPGHQSRPLYPRDLLPDSVFLLRSFFYCKRWHSTCVNNTNPGQAAWLWILNIMYLKSNLGEAIQKVYAPDFFFYSIVRRTLFFLIKVL